jgi:hypothetical protein
VAHEGALSPGQTRKHCCGNIVSYQCFAMFPRVGKHWETLVRNIGKHQMFLKLVGNILLPGKQILFPQQCFQRWANMETFEETSRITNVSATMFPSFPRALLPTLLCSLQRYSQSQHFHYLRFAIMLRFIILICL